jgi:lipid A 3-O-deacylase
MMIRRHLIKLLRTIVIFVAIFSISEMTSAGEKSTDEIPTRYGLAGILGHTFDPVSDINFLQITGFGMWDYDKVWHHWAPDPLRWKLEGTAGATTSPNTRAMISIGMMALYYLEPLSTSRLLPYVEGGIGIIYTDFQVEGQGSRFNFNPQIGIGTEFKRTDSDKPFFVAIRLSHISNAGLSSENRGVNSYLIMIGRFF